MPLSRVVAFKVDVSSPILFTSRRTMEPFADRKASVST